MTTISFSHTYEPLDLDLLVLCEVDYQPREPMTYYYPGCDEDVDITKVNITPTDNREIPKWLELMIIESLDDEELKTKALEMIHIYQQDALEAQGEYKYEQWRDRHYA